MQAYVRCFSEKSGCQKDISSVELLDYFIEQTISFRQEKNDFKNFPFQGNFSGFFEDFKTYCGMKRVFLDSKNYKVLYLFMHIEKSLQLGSKRK
jgi:hypothetical protein